MRWLIALLALTSPLSAADRCALDFDFLSGDTIGTISPGDTLHGTIAFTVTRELAQGSETVSYFVDGAITLSGDDLGKVTGALDIISIVRAPHTWDYVSMVASDVGGDLGGETRYFDPMIFTLADKPGSLADFALPRDTAGWNQLTRTQKFQFHTPDGNQIFFGTVSKLRGTCEAL